MDVVVNFSRLSDDDLYTQLDRIATKADEEVENAELVGILTAGSRDKWAAIRMQLMEGNLILEPRCEKTGLRGFRTGPRQTRLYNHRR